MISLRIHIKIKWRNIHMNVFYIIFLKICYICSVISIWDPDILYIQYHKLKFNILKLYWLFLPKIIWEKEYFDNPFWEMVYIFAKKVYFELTVIRLSEIFYFNSICAVHHLINNFYESMKHEVWSHRSINYNVKTPFIFKNLFSV